jgi:putative copper export protein
MTSTMVDALSAAVRALSFIALFQAAGIATFVAIFGKHLRVTLESTRRIGVVSALLAAFLVAIHYLLEAARMGGELAGSLDLELQSLVLHSSTATAGALRMAGIAFIVRVLRSTGQALLVQTAAGVGLVILSFTLMGHTASDAQRPLLQAVLVLHLAVVVFWFGALVPLYRASAHEPAMTAGTVAEAFSTLAIWIVPLLLLAGAVLAALLLPSVDALLLTTYGQLLLVKSGAFAGLMLLGALNKWRLGPALARGDSNAAPLFRRTLALEYALITAALGVTAVLTSFYSPH